MRVAAVVLAAGLLAAAAAARPESRPTVYAASSLTNVFPKIVAAKYSFAGSDTLTAQIRQGAPADVFASANMALPQGLRDDKLCSKPVVFTRNALIVIVPTANPADIHSVSDLTRHGVKVVVAAPSVPVGAYTRKVLAKLHLQAVLDNVVSEETDVREVLAKIALGEGDAGFVYRTDARTVHGKVTSIAIPARGQPDVRYGICVVAASSHKTAAHAFVSKVLGPRGQQILRRSGFLPRVKKG
jgi:molybdate transport system substrate-binding protein